MSFKDRFKSFFNTDEEYEYIEETEIKESPVREGRTGKNVVSLSTVQQQSSKVILCEPTSYNEVQEIADHLLNKRAVVINLQRLERTQAKRVVDFLSGTVYAIKGDIQKLGIATFLCTPDNVTVTGSISSVTFESEE